MMLGIVRAVTVIVELCSLIVITVYLLKSIRTLSTVLRQPSTVKLVYYLVVCFLISLYFLGIISTVFIFTTLSNGILFILPFFILFLIVFTIAAEFLPKWLKEIAAARKSPARWEKYSSVLSQETFQKNSLPNDSPVPQGDEEAESRFRQVAENAGEWIWEVDQNGLYTYTSSAVSKILGYTPEELILKKHIYDFFAPVIKENLKQKLFESFNKKTTFTDFQNPNVHKNGGAVILNSSGTPILDSNGTLLGFRGHNEDITGRRRAEQQLRESQALLRNIFNYSPDAIMVLDLSGTVFECNDVMVKMHGYASKEELIGKNFLTFVAVSSRAERQQNFVDAIKANLIRSAEFLALKKDGSTLFVEGTASLMKDPEGKPQGVVSIIRDITDRKKAELEIKNHNNELQQMNKLMIGRELKMTELKEKIKDLEAKISFGK